MTTAKAGTTPSKKMISYFTFECRSCVNLFSTLIGLKTCSGLTCTDSLHFKKKNQKISHCGSRFPKHVVLGQFTHVGLLLGVEQPPHKPIVFMVLLVPLSFCSLLFYVSFVFYKVEPDFVQYA